MDKSKLHAASAALCIAFLHTARPIESISPANVTLASWQPKVSNPQLAFALYVYSHVDSPAFAELRQRHIGNGEEEVLFRWPYEEGVDGYALSPAKSQVVAALGRTGNRDVLDDLWITSMHDKRLRPLTRDDAGYTGMNWSPDGRYVAYLSRQGVGQGPDIRPSVPWTVCVQPASSAKRTTLFRERPTPTGSSAPQVEWLTSRELLLLSFGAAPGIYLLRADGSRPPRLTRNTFDCFDVQSHRIWRFDGDKHRLYIWGLPSEITRLTLPAAWKSLPLIAAFEMPEAPDQIAFTPNGSQAALVLQSRGEPHSILRQLVAVEIASQQVRLMGTIEPGIEQFRWSKDARHIIFVRFPRSSGPEIVAADIDDVKPQAYNVVDWGQRENAHLITLVSFPRRSERIEWAEAR